MWQLPNIAANLLIAVQKVMPAYNHVLANTTKGQFIFAQ